MTMLCIKALSPISNVPLDISAGAQCVHTERRNMQHEPRVLTPCGSVSNLDSQFSDSFQTKIEDSIGRKTYGGVIGGVGEGKVGGPCNTDGRDKRLSLGQQKSWIGWME